MKAIQLPSCSSGPVSTATLAAFVAPFDLDCPHRLLLYLWQMLARDIRHLPVISDKGEVRGMLSIKDLIKEVAREKDALITKLSEFKLGRGAFFEHT